MAKKIIDWESVERDYRVGQLTIMAILEKYGIVRMSLQRKVKEGGWTRELAALVKSSTKAKIARNLAVRAHEESIAAGIVKDYDEVDLASNVNATLIMRHQASATAISDALSLMITELTDASANPQMLEQLVLAVGQNDPSAANGIAKAQTLASRINIAKAASETLAKLVAIERQAFGMDAQEDGSSDQKKNALLIKDLDFAYGRA